MLNSRRKMNVEHFSEFWIDAAFEENIEQILKVS